MDVKQPYQFALVDQRGGLIGEEFIDVIDSWDGVERWWRRQRGSSEILIGYIGYEKGFRFMEAPRQSRVWQTKKDQLNLPRVLFGRFGRGQRLRHQQIKARQTQTRGQVALTLQRHINEVSYTNMFERAQQYIRQGDIYQVNLSHRLEFHTTAAPADLFWHVFSQQPTPYAAYIQLPDYAILSYSPELFLRVHDGRVETRPMKGTRPRGRTSAQDARLREELFTSVKERAELDMIIDVHRNDLNRTARTGSVRVVRRREIVPYNTVWQAQARIVSEMARGYSPLDVMQTCFSAGSITGAPKLRAMEIIHELESVPRHIYCGSIGYITSRGDMKFNVAIRTGVLHQQTLYYSVGGGITFDAHAKTEWVETLAKAKIMKARFQ